MALTVKILSHGRTVRAKRGELLADVLERAGIHLHFYCNKRGLCGKCSVEVLKGGRALISAREKFWQKQRHWGKNYRLACLLEVQENLEIMVPEESEVQAVPILPRLGALAVKPDPAVKKFSLAVSRPTLAEPYSLLDCAQDGLGTKHLKIPLELLQKFGPSQEKEDFKITIIVHRNKEILDLQPASASCPLYGLAIDVGTTTLVVELVDLESGKIVDTAAAFNQQARRGADVVTRITYAMSGSEKAAELRTLVLDSLNRLINGLARKNGLSLSSIYEIIVAGNTAMNHLLLGVPVDSLGVAPYHSVFSRLPYFSASEVGFAAHPRAKVYFSPNIRSFVGGDIASGLLATRLGSRKGNFLFIDLGTNGEVVLKTEKRMVATSTAAGPAFEGMNLSCGMPALPGAIYKAQATNHDLELFTLGNRSARGVCGTGLIDLLAFFLEKGKISPGGKILAKNRKLAITPGLWLTQEDVRQVQLACAAIKTGIRLLLKRNRLRETELDRVFIAGAFGNYLNVRNSMRIGLLPTLDEGRVVFVGNSSLAGARLLLLSAKERDRVENLIGRIEYTSLASDSRFEEFYVEALEFKSWPQNNPS